jgi:3-dehydroquinate synthase
MQSIHTPQYDIHFNAKCYEILNDFLKKSELSKVFVLVDQHTHELCLPKFLAKLSVEPNFEIIEIPAGESHKTLDTCTQVWHALSELDADRKSILINLGGGVVTDLGGFVASAFKRGIMFINIPTSLLAMVDASVGGKTGVDLDGLKNQIGVINFSEMVLIDTDYLKTLPPLEMRSGLAEMLKHGLIRDAEYWKRLTNLKALKLSDLDQLIYHSVQLKKAVVELDPNEEGLRKILNFGHTLGHAIESYFLEHPQKTTLLHGEAIAIGMVLETYLSTKLLEFPETQCDEIKSHFMGRYGKVIMEPSDIKPIIDLLKFDKKNSHGQINFVLLSSIGNCKIDCTVDENLIYDAFSYYAL